jgi:hypothetical protein
VKHAGIRVLFGSASVLLAVSLCHAIPVGAPEASPGAASIPAPSSVPIPTPDLGPAAGVTATETCDGLRSADRLFESGAWDVAVTEYKRCLFFGKQGPNRDHAAERIGRAYWNLGEPKEAQKAFLWAADFASNDSVQSARRLDVALTWAGSGETSNAELELARLRLYARDPAIKREAALHLALIEVRHRRWDEARASLESVPGIFESRDGRAMDSLLQVANAVGLRSPDRARQLSSFLPGLGQITVGATTSGLHSLALNGVLTWQLIESVLDRQPGNTILVASFLHRYYRGSRHHAARLAGERNDHVMGPWIKAMELRLEAMGVTDWPLP